MIHNKLVRDQIPAIIAKKGDSVRVRRLSGDKLFEALTDKLLEEAAEFANDPSAEELADVLEVVEALAQHVGIEAVADAKRRKARDRGRFKDGVFLVETKLSHTTGGP